MSAPAVTAEDVARVVVEQGVSLAEAHRQLIESRPAPERPEVVTSTDWRERRHQTSGIVAAMEVLGINRQTLAERTGIPYSSLCAKVRGTCAITAVELAVIADALEVDAATLLAPLDTYVSPEQAELDELLTEVRAAGVRVYWRDEITGGREDAEVLAVSLTQYLDDGVWVLGLSRAVCTKCVLEVARAARERVERDVKGEGQVWFCRSIDPDDPTSRPSRHVGITPTRYCRTCR